MGKVITSGSEARDKIFAGIEELYNAVSSTLGPHGSTVVIEQPFSYPIITKDGVTVAKKIDFKDQYKNLGVQIIKQVAAKTDLVVGDGTTTATVLTYHLYKACLEMINSGAISKIDLIENLDKIKDQIIDLIKSHAIKISENSQLEDIARISSNSDESISKLVYEAFMSAGEKGIVTVDINTNPSDQLKVSDGMKLFTGLCAPQFINKRSTSECVLENLVVFITEDNLVSQKDAVHILKLALEHKKPLLVFAPVIAGEALATFIANKEQGIVECCCVTYPMYGAVRSEVIEELCAITGAMSVSLAAGTAITSAKKEHFGILKKASITVGNTLLTRDPNVSTERLDTIVADIKEKLKSCNINEAAKYSIRLERLCGTIVEIMVGGMTKVEVEERKDRFVDAISAVRAALEEGVVIGGGRELYNISNALELDEKFEFLRNVLKAPHNLILESSGIVPESPYPSDDVGYNAKTKEIGNMFEMGIVDPAKVTMTGIANSFSVVKVLLSTNVVLINQE